MIAFAATDDAGVTDVWVMNADGSERRRVTRSAADRVAIPFAWSPDGAQIAFGIGPPFSEIYAIGFVNADGTEQREVVDGIGPAWSPDGTRLLYQDAGFEGTNIRIMELPNGEPRALWTGSGPVWSPDGESVAFTSEPMPDGQHVYVAPAAGGPPRDLALGYGPQWSRDGRQLTFFAGRTDGRFEVRVIGADGSDERVLAEGERPSWSPDGSRIAFLRVNAAVAELQLWVVPANGSAEPVQLPVGDYDFAWSPDGDRIAVGVDADGDGAAEIHVLSADGATDEVIGPGDRPTWRPAPAE